MQFYCNVNILQIKRKAFSSKSRTACYKSEQLGGILFYVVKISKLVCLFKVVEQK